MDSIVSQQGLRVIKWYVLQVLFILRIKLKYIVHAGRAVNGTLKRKKVKFVTVTVRKSSAGQDGCGLVHD